MRKTERFRLDGPNPLWQMYRTIRFLRVFKNTTVVLIGRYFPSVKAKRWLYQTFLGMKIGEYSALALMVTPDVMFPERISIGRNTVIGFNSTILCHEYLVDEYRIGDVHIGDEVLIGANVTILPGVTIGDRAVIGAGAVVHRDVRPGERVVGAKLHTIDTK
ncbi:acyltransferase [Exiguobacterium aurantiacum]|uniref:Acyltransferase n=1 Tax=Exiguobacterium aurantiacum TaxID=33987 RepID=A0ABY5FQE6_9BACL|nr:acyltransferase [Exiguobacterium aurantiacum]UTT43826.1 acyltransferase [Exiguobacterium aurantiacum]